MKNLIFWPLRNINSIDVKTAKNALRLMDAASLAHPYALSNIVLSVLYKGKHNIYLFSVEFPISPILQRYFWPVIWVIQSIITWNVASTNVNRQMYDWQMYDLISSRNTWIMTWVKTWIIGHQTCKPKWAESFQVDLRSWSRKLRMFWSVF